MPHAEARVAAAAWLASTGRLHDAAIVEAGGGDDFPEVRLAAFLLGRSTGDRTRLESALRCYADPEFWDADIPEATLAFYDQGEIARLALAGADLVAPYRE